MLRGMVVAVVVLSACGKGPTEPPPSQLEEGMATARISGAETRAWDGTSVFYEGAEFSLVSTSSAAGESDRIVIHGLVRPTVGIHRIGLGDAPFHAFNSRGDQSGGGLSIYAAEEGELEITRSTPTIVEGKFSYTAFRYCLVTEAHREGPCTPPSEPIQNAARVQVSGAFSAIAHDQVPVVAEIVPATIDFYGDPVVIQTRKSVQRGAAIAVLVRSYGGGCTSLARTDVDVQGRVVTVRPMNTELRGAVCTQQLVMIDHEAKVTFDTPGPVTVIFEGARRPGDTLVTFERTVQVL